MDFMKKDNKTSGPAPTVRLNIGDLEVHRDLGFTEDQVQQAVSRELSRRPPEHFQPGRGSAAQTPPTIHIDQLDLKVPHGTSIDELGRHVAEHIHAGLTGGQDHVH